MIARLERLRKNSIASKNCDLSGYKAGLKIHKNWLHTSWWYWTSCVWTLAFIIFLRHIERQMSFPS